MEKEQYWGLHTVIGRKNETVKVVLQIIWDISILLSANNRSLRLESSIGLFQIICKTS